MAMGPSHTDPANASEDDGRHHSIERARASVSEGEDAIRNLKASESVSAAFHGQGMPAPPSGIADIIAAYVKAQTKSIAVADLKNMTPGAGSLGSSAASGVNLFLSMLTPAQREAAKAGVNPLDSAAVHRFETALRAGTPAQLAALSGRSSGERFIEIREAGIRSGVPASVVDDYAKQYSGMGFGRSAIGTFAAVGLAAGDFKALAQEWGRGEAVKGAETAKTFGFKGKDAVGDVTGLSSEEKSLWTQYRKANAKDDRDAILGKIHALAPRKNEDKDKADQRRDKIQQRFESLNQANAAAPAEVLTAADRADKPSDRKAEAAAVFKAMKKNRTSQKQP
ncbi:hypothetical protein [Bradyrhizobium sp.]